MHANVREALENAIRDVEAGEVVRNLVFPSEQVFAAALLPYMTEYPHLRFSLVLVPGDRVTLTVTRKGDDGDFQTRW